MTQLTTFTIALSLIFLSFAANSMAQDGDMEPEETEVWEPVPEKITPGSSYGDPPSDAIVLFDGSGFSNWEHPDGSDVKWKLEDGAMTVNPGTGGIQTKQDFGSVQLHIEWRAPEPSGEGQDRGNSGVFLQDRYEVQVLDSYNNKTYSNGMAGSIYKQHIPAVNAAKAPGEWQTYDIMFEAPEFNDDGSVAKPAYLTVFWNGIMVHNKAELKGPTVYIGHPEYEAYEGGAPLALQDHSHTVSFRNIWVRELDQ
ncbi:DUF1080 domain-containing protein [Aliifodinibius sp. S!AR15-10]|uniref:3-keto-disaccharide hydrolase n=1 Tax=Aliifodinibius sp. S!AR15-10 TaxID=2950437 RepID=UPI00285ABDE3|nr:DUF1080 domain-containing protein [Aliifodinibius sp. S!AR15-10]MDR8390927.1 DUF1080 domain-containing protein [Aliifodinibius sp. S!AR15-10]